jgi:F-type H+-transporting ATPase subunit delta
LAAQDSVLTQIARPYAQALFGLAQGENAVDEVDAGLTSISKLTDDSPDFERFLRSPVISADQKAAALDRIIEAAKPHQIVGKFLRVVARNGRLFTLPTIIKTYRELAAAARGEVSAEVTSAAPLSSGQLKSLADTLKAKIGKTVTLIEHVDPSLIGGLVVKVGSRMIDSSLKTKLSAMRVAMKEVG